MQLRQWLGLLDPQQPCIMLKDSAEIFGRDIRGLDGNTGWALVCVVGQEHRIEESFGEH